MRLLTVGALVSGIVLTSASSAAAASQTVGIDPGAPLYIPDRVAVKVGESVTWSNPGSEEPHNVHFEGEGSAQPSFPAQQFTTEPRTFDSPGEFQYYCDFHGRAMSGVVYVNTTGDLPPAAQLNVSPNPAVAGQPVTFDGSASSGTNNGVIATYEWDLDGDGMFEVNTGSTPTTSRTYLAAQTLTVTLRVTDGQGASGTRALPIQIDPAPAPPPAPAAAPPSSSTGDATVGRTTTPASFTFRSAATASRARGVAVKVTCPGRCKFIARLTVSARVARRARLGRKATTIGLVRGEKSAAGTKSVRIKLSPTARRRLARLKSVPALLKLEVSGASGPTQRKQKSLTLKR